MTYKKNTPNEIIDNRDGTSYVCLYNRKGDIVAKALIDSDDVLRVSQYKWSFDGKYAGRIIYNPNGKGKSFRLHQFIFGETKGIIDHINRDTMDNRKCNLREATRKTNTWNKTKYSWSESKIIGVRFVKETNKWQAGICVYGKDIYLGRFPTKREAITARREAELKYFGEFAPNHYFESIMDIGNEHLPSEFLDEIQRNNDWVNNKCREHQSFCKMNLADQKNNIAIAAGLVVLKSEIGATVLLSRTGLEKIVRCTLAIAELNHWGEVKQLPTVRYIKHLENLKLL